MDKKLSPRDKWNKANTKIIPLRVMKNTESDIIDHLGKQENRSGYIKKAIRNQIIEKENEEKQKQLRLIDKTYYLIDIYEGLFYVGKCYEQYLYENSDKKGLTYLPVSGIDNAFLFENIEDAKRVLEVVIVNVVSRTVEENRKSILIKKYNPIKRTIY